MSTWAVAIFFALMTASESSRGIALYRQRQFQTAEAEFQRALVKNPRDSTTRLYLARTLIELQRVPDSLTDVKRFADLQGVAPNSASLRELAGGRFEMKGGLTKSIEEYRAAERSIGNIRMGDLEAAADELKTELVVLITPWRIFGWDRFWWLAARKVRHNARPSPARTPDRS